MLTRRIRHAGRYVHHFDSVDIRQLQTVCLQRIERQPSRMLLTFGTRNRLVVRGAVKGETGPWSCENRDGDTNNSNKYDNSHTKHSAAGGKDDLSDTLGPNILVASGFGGVRSNYCRSPSCNQSCDVSTHFVKSLSQLVSNHTTINY